MTRTSTIGTIKGHAVGARETAGTPGTAGTEHSRVAGGAGEPARDHRADDRPDARTSTLTLRLERDPVLELDLVVSIELGRRRGLG
jgi:hypothetical protein